MTTDNTLSSVQQKFHAYRQLVFAVGTGDLKCLLCAGGAGLGKTFEATAVLAEFGARIKVTRNAGRTTPLALYRDLFDARTIRDVLLYDDCDEAFANKDCLNLLKAATDTRQPREITWSSSSKLVPCKRFKFSGRIIIITNRAVFADPKLSPLADRAHCFELVLSKEERLERILSLLRSIAKVEVVYFEVSDWITRNADRLHSLDRLTVRSAVKAVELSKINHAEWQDLAALTLLGETEIT